MTPHITTLTMQCIARNRGQTWFGAPEHRHEIVLTRCLFREGTCESMPQPFRGEVLAMCCGSS